MIKMNKLLLPIRSYSTKRDKKFQYRNTKFVNNAKVLKTNGDNRNPGISNRLRMYQEDEMAAGISASHKFEELHEDMDEFESDFMNAGTSHRMHEGELAVQKEKLKTKITFSKYLKEVEPSFLTFAEKEEIKSLHERDPNEWSVERLSESFPALPATIKKVLHAKWSPKSVETVLRYDEKVISNWEAFHAGELPVTPTMEKHLQNFKDRHIVLTGREQLAKRFVPPKMKFPKPKSTIFSKIAENFLLPNVDQKVKKDDENADLEIRKNVEGDSRDFKANADFDEENVLFKTNKNSNSPKTYFESNRDFHKKRVLKNNRSWDKNNADFESSRKFDEENVRIKSNRNFDNKNMDFETSNSFDRQNLRFISKINYNNKNTDFESSSNLDCKIRNFEKNENKHQVQSLTIRKRYQNTEVSPKEENQMTLLSQNLNEYDCTGKNKRLTFDEFLIKNVGQTKDSSDPEDIVLKETYKRHMEKIAFDTKSASSPKESEIEKGDFHSESEVCSVERKLSSVSLNENEKGSESRISRGKIRRNEVSNFNKEPQTDLISKREDNELSLSVDRSELNTYVKEWIKKGDDLEYDPDFIKIPKNRYKEGMTYRVRNCYYDDDGEFLYKVPEVHN
ncbi:uncharacterized protein LOC117177137 [Belonocnema kinseyi]|uniref:uncharacterized protein LOC117177137 n=1 Tax=Belonocnema kinseyi TaxID=2817044 RepID=UPI00143DD945|nr:uncharacterized protein LOC117177137 [Belonocnema kinseyi]